jgi:hypothetical protein
VVLFLLRRPWLPGYLCSILPFPKSRTFLKRGPQGTRDILIKHGLTCLLNKGELDSLIKKRIIFCINFYVAYEDIIQQWSMETLSSCGWIGIINAVLYPKIYLK